MMIAGSDAQRRKNLGSRTFADRKSRRAAGFEWLSRLAGGALKNALFAIACLGRCGVITASSADVLRLEIPRMLRSSRRRMPADAVVCQSRAPTAPPWYSARTRLTLSQRLEAFPPVFEAFRPRKNGWIVPSEGSPPFRTVEMSRKNRPFSVGRLRNSLGGLLELGGGLRAVDASFANRIQGFGIRIQGFETGSLSSSPWHTGHAPTSNTLSWRGWHNAMAWSRVPRPGLTRIR
jgi:hypothetical protein